MKEKPKRYSTSLVLPKTLVLVGMMGAGKSSVGWRLARRLGIPFSDTDQEVEKAAGCSVADIFETWGEKAFRDAERRILKRLLRGSIQVVSTGDGAFFDEESRLLIKENAISLWLRADPVVLYERVIRRDTRPLLFEGDAKQILEEMVERRYPIYAKADLIVESNDDAHEATIERVIEALKSYIYD
ncbi:MAG: shikimate kinase [Alphaproteobacteria bacterium]|nr:shikimate kinase [Alphaproteobacteria bacterium]